MSKRTIKKKPDLCFLLGSMPLFVAPYSQYSFKKDITTSSQGTDQKQINGENIETLQQNQVNLTKDISPNYFSDMNWPFVVLVIALFFLFLFRKSIAGFIGKLKEFKAGKDGIHATSLDENSSLIISEKKEGQISDDAYVKENEDESKKESWEPVTLDDWRRKMFISALIEKDKKQTEEAYKKLIELSSDAVLLEKDKVSYLELSHKLGDTDAVPKLKELLSDSKMIHAINLALGYCYENSDDLRNADFFYRQSLQVSKSNKEKVDSAQPLARVLYRDGKKSEAIDILSEILTAVQEDEFRATLYESLSDIYDREKDYENKAFTIDKAIELKPNDTTLLFKAGYSYAESKYNELSLLHYRNASDINPNDSAVQNNIGVQYDNLKMPIKSIESYKKSQLLGNTLASANLAYRFLQNGFVEEARELLDLAKVKDDVHQNVNAAISEIPEKIEEETKVEKEQIKSALLFRKFVLGFTEAKFIKDDLLNSVSGNWKSNDGIVFEISIMNNKIVAHWKKKIFLDIESDYKFEGEILNNSSTIDFYENRYVSSKSGYEYKKENRGLLYYSKDDGLIKYVEISSSFNLKIVHVLTRVD
ncbi:MAG: hypothetical protein COW50_03815 [Candidatus Moranbacteria bacterium CG17_big_fil_post_rev_8_21_14_2_50_41_107]|nr:MAG: hypothetical protein COW50_03815 [Candidatus Moranbacteria bacterium CG17_big_fil_post_rev_8_21_14_2_50_41_107]